MTNILDQLSKTRVPGKGQDPGQPSIPAGAVPTPFDAPHQVPVLDPGTGVPIVGRPKLDRYPLGPINLDLPSDKPALRMDQLFQRVFAGGNLDVSSPAMQLALACWMATSKEVSILRTQIQQLSAVINNLQQGVADAQEHALALRMEHATMMRFLRHHGLLEPPRPDTEWEEVEEGRYARFFEDVHLEAMRVAVFRHPSGELVVFDYDQIENVQSADPGWIGRWDGLPMGLAEVEDAGDGPYDGLQEVQAALEKIAHEYALVEGSEEASASDEADEADEADKADEADEADEADQADEAEDQPDADAADD